MIILTLLDTPKTWIDHNMEYGVLWQSYRTYWLGQIVNWMQSDMKVRLGSLKRHCKSQNECEELGRCLFRKIVSGKPLSKLSCVCLLLEKVVNGKHFPVKGKHFLVKEKFSLVFRKVFSWNIWAENTFRKLWKI
jgi:hypothetical protein